MELKLQSAEAEEAQIIINMIAEDGQPATLKLGLMDVSALISMLYQAQADALKQEPSTAPEVMMPIVNFAMGQNKKNAIFRAFVTDRLYQDYFAPKSSPLGLALIAFSTEVARQFDIAPEPFGRGQKN